MGLCKLSGLVSYPFVAKMLGRDIGCEDKPHREVFYSSGNKTEDYNKVISYFSRMVSEYEGVSYVEKAPDTKYGGTMIRGFSNKEGILLVEVSKIEVWYPHP